MPPRTRSSTPSTPTPKKQQNSETPTRKSPRCAQCQRPRAGHPRQGCPYAETPTKQEISDALSGLDIADAEDEYQRSPHRRRSSLPKKVAFANQPSLESLSTQSSELVRNILSANGEDSDEDTETEGSQKHIQKWRYSIPKQYPHSGMPGTLVTPQSSFDSIDIAKLEPHTPEPLDSSPPRRPLVHTLSWQERDELIRFTSAGSTVPQVSIITLAPDAIPAFIQRADRTGLHFRLLPSEDGKDVPTVMGHDEKEVQRVFTSLQADLKSPSKNAGGGSSLKAVAGGAVVGAVATFTSLAFT